MSQLCGGTGPAAPKAISPAEDAMDFLEKANHDLHAAVAELHSRLSPVLMTLPPSPDSEAARAEGCSVLVEQLRRRTEQVQAVTDRVQTIIASLSI